ncbi:hypothetical protein [Flavisolibacter nicotianae]|uniref:hypothetical protein n=1 Tax=Flavisolibacter nicotianae TaxID=2364882 RepID=UPI0013C488BB|nr:hypothetical protein [Flavisolibacter nicotianae]
MENIKFTERITRSETALQQNYFPDRRRNQDQTKRDPSGTAQRDWKGQSQRSAREALQSLLLPFLRRVAPNLFDSGQDAGHKTEHHLFRRPRMCTEKGLEQMTQIVF